MFAEYIAVDTDFELSLKVANSVKNKISVQAYEMIVRVALSDYAEKADLIYRFLILGFATGRKVTEHLSNEVVNTVFRVDRKVNYEAHHFLGFIRFSQQQSGLLTSVIHPKSQVLPLVAPHFADRLPGEKFLIYDANHKFAAFHTPGKPWILAKVPELEEDSLNQKAFKEDDYQDLWKTFYHHISIKERENYALQRNNLPIRFRADMTEFKQ